MITLSTQVYKVLVTSNSNQAYLNLNAKFVAPMIYGRGVQHAARGPQVARQRF